MITIKTPTEYINQPDIIGLAGNYIKKYGKKALIIGSKTPLKVVGEPFYNSLHDQEIEYTIIEFNGFPTMETIKIYAEKAVELGVDLLIGIGGGKVSDTVKVVGSKTKLPVIIIPTIAATCASWAACSIIYHEDGDFDTVYWNEITTRLIIADSRIIATAPARYMNAGIVDTLAKWYETVPNLKIAEDNITLNVSLSGAELAFEVLAKQGQKAVEEGQKNIISKATIDTIDAIIYLAGLVGSFAQEKFYGGFAHPFYNASTRLPNTRNRLHGEKVALGLLIQLVLENKPEDNIVDTILDFNRYHLALTLEDIGIKENVASDVHKISTILVEEFSEYTQLGFGKTTEEIEDAIFKTDDLVKKVLNR